MSEMPVISAPQTRVASKGKLFPLLLLVVVAMIAYLFMREDPHIAELRTDFIENQLPGIAQGADAEYLKQLIVKGHSNAAKALKGVAPDNVSMVYIREQLHYLVDQSTKEGKAALSKTVETYAKQTLGKSY